MSEEGSPQSEQTDSKEESRPHHKTANTPAASVLDGVSPLNKYATVHTNPSEPTAGDAVNPFGEDNTKEPSTVESSVLEKNSSVVNEDGAPGTEDGSCLRFTDQSTSIETNDAGHNSVKDAYLYNCGSIDMASKDLEALSNDVRGEAMKSPKKENEDSPQSSQSSNVFEGDRPLKNYEGMRSLKCAETESLELQERDNERSGFYTGTEVEDIGLAHETEGSRSAEKTLQMECHDVDDVLITNEPYESVKLASGLHDAEGGNKESTENAVPDQLLNVEEKTSDLNLGSSVVETSALDHSDDDTASVGACAFELLGNRRRKKKKSTTTMKPIQISISLPPQPEMDLQDSDTPKKDILVAMSQSIPINSEDDEVVCYNFDYSDVDSDDNRVGDHQMSAKAEDQHRANLDALQAEKDADLAKIKAFLDAKWEERRIEMEKEIKRLRGEMLAKQERQRKQLASNHKKKLEAEKAKIEEAIALSLHQQKNELSKLMLKSQQEKQQRGLCQDKMTEWDNIMSDLRDRHREKLSRLESRKVELKKKSELEFKAQSNILATHHKKRQFETDKHADDLAKQYNTKQEQLKAQVLRLHTDRYNQKLKDIQAQLSDKETPRDKDYNAKASKEVHLSHSDSLQHYDVSISHHAVARHKRRKISTNNAPFGMSVEVHNEGIIIMTRSSDAEHAKSKRMSVFLPWCSKARRVLYSVMCGEIPSEISNIYFTGGKDLVGGLVRCMITDMRTSEDTAICDRAESLLNHLASKRESEIVRLSKQENALNKQVSELSAEYKNAVKLEKGAMAAQEEASKAHNESQQTWARYKSLFNEDGSLSATVLSEKRQQFLNAMARCKEKCETTESYLDSTKKPLEGARVAKLTKKMELEKLRDHLADINSKLKKLRRESSSSKAFKSASATYTHDCAEEDTSGRIDDIITAIHLTADKRRVIVNEKKANNNSVCSVWDKKMDEFDIDSSLKKSIWQKMQRKRINTILRPSHQNIVQNILNETKSSSKISRWFDMGPDEDLNIDQSLRTEEMILLALHPAPPADPPSHELHEPGWHLCLDTPQDMKRKSHSILPIDKEGLVSQGFLSVCCSTGRQAASLLNPHHLRTLSINTPSTFSYNASSLAESNPTYHQRATADTIYSDPLSESEEQIQRGYSFVVRERGKKKRTIARAYSSGRKTQVKNQKESKAASTAPSVSKSKPAAIKTAGRKVAAKNPPEKKPATKKTATKKHKVDKSQRKTKSIASKHMSKSTEEKSSHLQQKQASQQFTDSSLNDTGNQVQQAQVDPRNAERNTMLQMNEQIGVTSTVKTAEGVLNQSSFFHNGRQQQHTGQQSILQQQQQQQHPNLEQQQQQQQPNFQQQQYQQLLMARNYLQMFNQQQQSSNPQNYGRQEEKIQNQQQNLPHLRLQDQQRQQNNGPMAFSYIQTDQGRLAFSQPPMSQLMQQNMMGNNSQMQNGQQHFNAVNRSNFQLGKPADKK